MNNDRSKLPESQTLPSSSTRKETGGVGYDCQVSRGAKRGSYSTDLGREYLIDPTYEINERREKDQRVLAELSSRHKQNIDEDSKTSQLDERSKDTLNKNEDRTKTEEVSESSTGEHAHTSGQQFSSNLNDKITNETCRQDSKVAIKSEAALREFAPKRPDELVKRATLFGSSLVDLCHCSNRLASEPDQVIPVSQETKPEAQRNEAAHGSQDCPRKTSSMNQKVHLEDKQRKSDSASVPLKQTSTSGAQDSELHKEEEATKSVSASMVHQHVHGCGYTNFCSSLSSFRPRSSSLSVARSSDIVAARTVSKQVSFKPVAVKNVERDQNLNMVSVCSNSKQARVENLSQTSLSDEIGRNRAISTSKHHPRSQTNFVRENDAKITNKLVLHPRRSDPLKISEKYSTPGDCETGNSLEKVVADEDNMRQIVGIGANENIETEFDQEAANRVQWKSKTSSVTCDSDEYDSDCQESQSISLTDEDSKRQFSAPSGFRERNEAAENNNSERVELHARSRRSQSVGNKGFRQDGGEPIERYGGNELNLEALIVESWLDEHLQFAHDYFLRKASRQLIDDWLALNSKPDETKTNPRSDSHIDSLISRRVAQFHLNGKSLHEAPPKSDRPDECRDAPVFTNQGSFSAQNSLKCRPLRSNSQSGGTMLNSYLSCASTMNPVRKISATDFETRTGNILLRPMLSTTPDGRLTFLSQTNFNTEPVSESGPNLRAETQNIKRKQSSASHGHPNVFDTKQGRTVFESEPSKKTQSEGEDHHPSDGNQDTLQSEISEFDSSQDSLEHDSDDEDLNGEVKLIFELVKNICNDLDIRTLLHKILKNIAILINADRSSLFLVAGTPDDPNRHLVSQLFNVDQDSAVEEPTDCIVIPWGKGLVGYVAESGESVNIANCYEDPRFTDSVDQRTGYLTKHMLCAPIFDKRGEIVGVAQVINKRDGNAFTKNDEIKFKRYLQFCGIGLRNAQSFEHCQLENRRNQVLLDLARMVFEEQSSIEQVVYRIMLHTQSLLDCERCQVLLIDSDKDDIDSQLRDLNGPACSMRRRDETTSSINQCATDERPKEWKPQCQYREQSPPSGNDKKALPENLIKHNSVNIDGGHLPSGQKEKLSPELFSLVFDLECDGDNDPRVYNCKDINKSQDNISTSRVKNFPINIGITGYVALTGETLNIEDAHSNDRFDASVDEGSDFKHRSILCMPIRNGRRQIIGVSQLINKKNGKPFNKNDEDLFEAFSIFCGLGIQNTLMYERVLKIMAKQRVTFEVLSYHATAPLEEAKKLNQEIIPSCFALNLTSLKFNDFSLDDQSMLKSCIRFFLDLDLIRRFQIDKLVFCNWVLSVQKNYRKVTYHPIVGKYRPLGSRMGVDISCRRTISLPRVLN